MKTERRKEENLRSSIQREVARVQQGASEIASVRAQNIEAEKELLAAQNMEESTRTRAHALENQIASEKKETEEQIVQLSSQIAVQTKKAEDFANQHEQAKKALNARTQEFNEARARQQTLWTRQDGIDAFNRAEVESSMASSQSQANELHSSNGALQKKIEEMEAAIRKNAEVSAANRKTSEKLTSSGEEMLASEKSRSEELSAFSSELDLERKAVEKLEASARELQESRKLASTDRNQMVVECEKALEQARQQIDLTKSAIDSENAEIVDEISGWETEKADILRRLEEGLKNFKTAEASMNAVDATSKNLEDESESLLRQDLLAVEERKAAEQRAIQAQISAITQSKF
jgi:chromosome segregation ATPase